MTPNPQDDLMLGPCSIPHCRNQSSHEWPLLSYRLCAKHDTKALRPAGADNPPDDFDIPDWDEEAF
jgi:hypothetical protein